MTPISTSTSGKPKTVIIDIDAEGNVKVGAQGAAGSGCQQLTQAIEAALGKTTADQKTSEYFQKQTVGANANAATPAQHRR